MSNAAFLLVAVGFSVVVSVVIWAVNRKPKTFMSSIDDFEREMRALGRDPDVTAGGRRRGSPPRPRGVRQIGPDAAGGSEEHRP